MDFSVIFQLRNKKFWWMDVIFYFAISLLISTVLCYVIFLTKNIFLVNDIKKETEALLTVGTYDQKNQEKDVIDYKKKINDFTVLFKNHEFSSNVFALMQTQTMPNIWFGQFILDEKNNAVQLLGEADSMDAFSRQMVSFEKNKYIKNVVTLNSSSGESSRISFGLNLALDKNIFDYFSEMAAVLSGSNLLEQLSEQQNKIIPVEGQQIIQTPSSEKFLTSFHILLTPEVIGTLDQTNYVVILDVPYNTDVKNLVPSIDVSPKATVSPLSNVSQDFTNPIIYTVTAEDDSVQLYKVFVNVLNKAGEKSGKSNTGVLVTIILFVIVVIIVASIAGFFIWKKMKSNKANFSKQ
jgi:hypothetical protein